MMIPACNEISVKINKKKYSVKNCTGIKSLRGLMFDSMDDKHGALIYANNIWMPFVRHELDLLFLDDKFNVLEIKRAVPISFKRKTWRTYKNKEATYCLELKVGLIRGRVRKVEI